VVDLIAGNLKRFSTITQEALKQLACLGNVAEIVTLTVVHGKQRKCCTRHSGKPSTPGSSCARIAPTNSCMTDPAAA